MRIEPVCIKMVRFFVKLNSKIIIGISNIIIVTAAVGPYICDLHISVFLSLATFYKCKFILLKSQWTEVK